MLRHEIAVMRREVAAPARNWADRAVIAAAAEPAICHCTGSWGLAVALTLHGGQHCGRLAAGQGVAAAKISTALDTQPTRTRRSPPAPAVPAAMDERAQLSCSPNGSGGPWRSISRNT